MSTLIDAAAEFMMRVGGGQRRARQVSGVVKTCADGAQVVVEEEETEERMQALDREQANFEQSSAAAPRYAASPRRRLGLFYEIAA